MSTDDVDTTANSIFPDYLIPVNHKGDKIKWACRTSQDMRLSV